MSSESDKPSPRKSVGVAILAAGHGTRMKSKTAKHIHHVAGVPIVERIIRAAQKIEPDHIAVVLSPGMMDLGEQLGMNGEFDAVCMEVPTGTAKAVQVAIEALPEVEYIVSLLGDNPLLTGETIEKLVGEAVESGHIVTVLTCLMDDAAGYGRIDRDELGRARAIVERDNDDPLKRIGVTEINSGIMVLQRNWALDAIRRLEKDPVKGEYLLTDLVSMAVSEFADSDTWPVATVMGPVEVSVGINDRTQQAEADSIVRRQVRERHMRNGVSMVGPETIFIDETVTIGQDTVLLPGTILLGQTTIGENCTIGPYAVLIDTEVHNGVTIRSSTLEHSTVGTGADTGPYAHLRSGSVIGENVHIGNFVELKNTVMDADSRSGHFSYIGDAHIGARTNIGAGTITANFDGVTKHHTEVGEDVFIGSDSVLIAPLQIESNARTGAGSVVTRDVSAGQTVVGVPARPIHKHSDDTRE